MKQTDYLTKQIIIVSTVTIISFPLIILLDSLVSRFWVAYVEELLGRFIPLLLTYILLPRGTLGDRVTVGIVCGMTFGILEIWIKVIQLGYFTPLMIVPLSFVHCVNGIIASTIIGESIENRWWTLIPLAYILCSFWHALYNTGLVGFV